MALFEAPPNGINNEVDLGGDYWATVTPQLGGADAWHVGQGRQIHAHLHLTSEGYRITDPDREIEALSGASWSTLVREFYRRVEATGR